MALAYQPRDETLGRYRLFARLGRGGMAELYVARLIGAARVEKLVVIKRMLPHLVEDPQFVAMFENEGRIAARLTHPNVCQTYELDEADGQLFLVMEFLRGLPWSDIVPALPADELERTRFIVGVLVQACEGLHYAHHLIDPDGQATPIVHRDVSPENLMITTDGVIKLLDFGVSKMLTESSATRAGMIKGKLPYMSPEQIRGEPVDGRADLFALGVVLWEALSGTRLFDRNSDFQIWKAVTEEPIPRLPDTPITAALEGVVQRALARDRDGRQASARMLADELRAALAPFGTPMSQSEIQHAIATWMQPSLARESRDLAAAISQLREGDAEAALTRALDVSRTSVDLIVGRAPVTQVIGAAGVPAHDEVPALAAWGELEQVTTPRDPSEDTTTEEDDPGASSRAPLARAPKAPSPSDIQVRNVSMIVTNRDDGVEAPTTRAPSSRRSAPPRPAITPDVDLDLDLDQPVLTPPHLREAARAVERAAPPVLPSLLSLAPTGPRLAPIAPTESVTEVAPTSRRPAVGPPAHRRPPAAPFTAGSVDPAGSAPPRRWWILVLLLSVGIGIAAAIAVSGGRAPMTPAVTEPLDAPTVDAP